MILNREMVLHYVLEHPGRTAEEIRDALELPSTATATSLVEVELESAARSRLVQAAPLQGTRRWSRATGLMTVVTIDWWKVSGLLGSYLRNYAGAGSLFSDADLLAHELRGLADRVVETAEEEEFVLAE